MFAENDTMATLPSFILSVIFSVLSTLHPVHVSVTDVELSRKDQELQVIVRIFTDDLETEIRRELKLVDMDILAPTNGQTSEQIFEAYLKRHLKFTVNQMPRKFSYLGFEEESGAVISYLLIDDVAQLNALEVTNDILLREFDDQVNLLHVTIDGDISTMKFVRNKETSALTF